MKDTLQSKKTYASPRNAKRAAYRDGKKYVGWVKLPAGRFAYRHTVEVANEATLIDVLNDEEGRALVDQIEDVESSLRSYPQGDSTLEDMRATMVAELADRFGFEWTR